MIVADTAIYVELVWRRRGRPIVRSMRFRFLANDRSWYERLPLRGVGEPFSVYLDPNVLTITGRTRPAVTNGEP